MELAKLAGVEELWKMAFGEAPPEPVVVTVAIVAVVLAMLLRIARAVKEIKPLFYDPEERRRVRRRRRFAEHIAREIERIDDAADWSEHRYAELEAEVEAEGRRRQWFGTSSQSTLRRERSLSRALRNSRERLILLEGEPGAGKSVALRHLTVVVAAAAARSRSAKSVVPLYVNLKTIDRAPGRSVDAELIREHVLRTLKAANVRDVEEFLDHEFARGLEDGTWLFLFDSFDEIPDVLSATTAETSIRDYARAIATFLTSMNACRGVVASRYFRGPGSLGWPRFRILALSDDYRRRLIRRADLPVEVERELIGQFDLAGPALSVTSRNPMFLGLLCQHMAKGNPFPDTVHTVFEDYVDTRLRRDQDKLLRRFGVGSVLVREAAEQAAFCMAYHPALGLSPSREALAAAMKARGYTGDPSLMFDSLEFIKLARPEETPSAATFTFAHRRFQEYFATCVVLDAPDVVTPERLLTDARWRETAVVLLQTQSGERLAAIVEAVERLLERDVATMEADAGPVGEREPGEVRELTWPPLTLHLLSLLQSGYQGRAGAAPERLRELVGRVVSLATVAGTLTDRKWALEVAGIAPSPILTRAIADAFNGHSRWLAEVAYRQAALLAEVPRDIAGAIHRELVRAFASGRLRRERDATFAHIRRLPRHEEFIRSARLLLHVPFIDVGLHALLFVVLLGRFTGTFDAAMAALALMLSAATPYVSAQLWLSRATSAGEMAVIVALIAAGRALFLLLVMLVGDSTAISVTVTIVGLWSVSAMAAAASGQFTAPGWWPLLSAVPIALAVKSARRSFEETSLRKVFESTGLLAFCAAYVIVSHNPWDSPAVALAIAVLVPPFCAVVFIPAAISVWRLWASRLADYQRWMEVAESRNRFSDAAEMAGVFRELETARWQARFIELVVQRSMLDATRENEAAVRRLALEYENASAKIAIAAAVKPTWRDRLYMIVRPAVANDPIARARVTDALSILAEQLRSRRAA